METAMVFVRQFFRRLWPAVPCDVRDDLALLRLGRLRAQVPLLYITTILVVMASMSAADPRASFAIKYGMPMTIVMLSAARLGWWLTQHRDIVVPEQARAMTLRTTAIAAFICALSSSWTVMSWLDSVPGQRTYYPMFMAIGALAGAFCLSSVRFATLALLVVGVLPVIAALVIAGNHMDMIAGGVVLLASLFLMQMIQQQHSQIVDLLRLQRGMRTLAETDALTGLPNRRALYDLLIVALGQPARTGVALLDLDGFKPVNDAHGHATGDRLLCEVAHRLDAVCGTSARAFRQGGDEFAIMMENADPASMAALASALLVSLAVPFAIDGHRLSIGASVGTALSRADDSGDSLIARADTRLYAAKAQRGSDLRRRIGDRMAHRAAS
jgi:diguanylate cyclase